MTIHSQFLSLSKWSGSSVAARHGIGRKSGAIVFVLGLALLAGCSSFCCQKPVASGSTAPGSSIAVAEYYTTVLYYDKNKNLINAEDARKGFKPRTLLPLNSSVPIPPMRAINPQYEACVDGMPVDIGKSHDVKFAIYYRPAQKIGEEEVREPIAWEDFTSKPVRTVTCQADPATNPNVCSPPKHCVSTCAGASSGSCANYCCVY
jgi:hypothetical protein